MNHDSHNPDYPERSESPIIPDVSPIPPLPLVKPLVDDWLRDARDLLAENFQGGGIGIETAEGRQMGIRLYVADPQALPELPKTPYDMPLMVMQASAWQRKEALEEQMDDPSRVEGEGLAGLDVDQEGLAPAGIEAITPEQVSAQSASPEGGDEVQDVAPPASLHEAFIYYTTLAAAQIDEDERQDVLRSYEQILRERDEFKLLERWVQMRQMREAHGRPHPPTLSLDGAVADQPALLRGLPTLDTVERLLGVDEKQLSAAVAGEGPAFDRVLYQQTNYDPLRFPPEVVLDAARALCPDETEYVAHQLVSYAHEQAPEHARRIAQSIQMHMEQLAASEVSSAAEMGLEPEFHTPVYADVASADATSAPVDAFALLSSIDSARLSRNLVWDNLPEQTGAPALVFQRLSAGETPSEDDLQKLLAWLDMPREWFSTTAQIALDVGKDESSGELEHGLDEQIAHRDEALAREESGEDLLSVQDEEQALASEGVAAADEELEAAAEAENVELDLPDELAVNDLGLDGEFADPDASYGEALVELASMHGMDPEKMHAQIVKSARLRAELQMRMAAGDDALLHAETAARLLTTREEQLGEPSFDERAAEHVMQTADETDSLMGTAHESARAKLELPEPAALSGSGAALGAAIKRLEERLVQRARQREQLGTGANPEPAGSRVSGLSDEQAQKLVSEAWDGHDPQDVARQEIQIFTPEEHARLDALQAPIDEDQALIVEGTGEPHRFDEHTRIPGEEAGPGETAPADETLDDSGLMHVVEEEPSVQQVVEAGELIFDDADLQDEAPQGEHSQDFTQALRETLYETGAEGFESVGDEGQVVYSETFMSALEVAEQLSVKPERVEQWIASGVLSCMENSDGKVRISTDAIVQFLNRQKELYEAGEPTGMTPQDMGIDAREDNNPRLEQNDSSDAEQYIQLPPADLTDDQVQHLMQRVDEYLAHKETDNDSARKDENGHLDGEFRVGGVAGFYAPDDGHSEIDEERVDLDFDEQTPSEDQEPS